MPLGRKTVLGAGLALALLVIGFVAYLRRPGPVSPPASPAAAPTAPVVYDPTKLLENGVPAGEVFNEEPRSNEWADVVETVVGASMRRDLATMVPAAGVEVRCKTLSCLVGVEAPEDQRAKALAVTKFMMLAPWVVDLEPEEDGTLRWLFFEEPRFADPQAFVAWFQRVRKQTLENIRAGKAPNPFPVPASEAPRE